MNPISTFGNLELRAASKEWGCNCGPAALAFATQRSLQDARQALVGFDRKFYVTPTMMEEALSAIGTVANRRPPIRSFMFREESLALCRIQFTGPWTAPEANPRWAYKHTHWIVSWIEYRNREFSFHVFDVNDGTPKLFSEWLSDTLPKIVASIERADGNWKPTHIWSVEPLGARGKQPPVELEDEEDAECVTT